MPATSTEIPTRTLAQRIFNGDCDAKILNQWNLGRNTCEISTILFRQRNLEPDIERRLVVIRDAAFFSRQTRAAS